MLKITRNHIVCFECIYYWLIIMKLEQIMLTQE